MSVTLSELESFHHFAAQKLRAGGTATIDELVRQWQAAREREEVNEALREATEDLRAGRYRPAEDISRDLERKFGFPS